MYPKLMIAALAAVAVLAMSVDVRAAGEQDVRWDCCYKNGGRWNGRSCNGLTAAGNSEKFRQCVAQGTGKPYKKPLDAGRGGLPSR